MKVLIYDGSHLKEKDLDQHFMQYGQLSSSCVIRRGEPNYAYVNFKDPESAQNAREGKHLILGATLTPTSGKSNRDPARSVQPVSYTHLTLPTKA